MRPNIWCDGWKRKYFGFAWEVNGALVAQVGPNQEKSQLIHWHPHMATWFVTPPPLFSRHTFSLTCGWATRSCHFCTIAPHLRPYLLQSDHALPPPVHPPRPPSTYLHRPDPQLRPLLQGTIYAQAVECKNPCGPPGGKNVRHQSAGFQASNDEGMWCPRADPPLF
jgi:hypothetical protein